MENNINDKIRVNTYTKLDDNEEKLLDEVFWSSYLWLILIETSPKVSPEFNNIFPN